MAKEKTYFISDLHLGAPALRDNLEREKRFVQWLEFVRKDARAIYLVGDIFDFWFEYKWVVPKGFVRTFGKLAALADDGIEIYFFKGNHDLWTFDYFEKEIGIKVFDDPVCVNIGNKKFYIGHGDGLDPNEKGYLVLKRIFRSKFLQWSFKRLHPNFALWLGNAWSKKSRLGKMGTEDQYKGDNKEATVVFAQKHNEKHNIDYYVFGHRHILEKVELKGTTVFHLGDWINHYSYGQFDGTQFELKKYL